MGDEDLDAAAVPPGALPHALDAPAVALHEDDLEAEHDDDEEHFSVLALPAAELYFSLLRYALITGTGFSDHCLQVFSLSLDRCDSLPASFALFAAPCWRAALRLLEVHARHHMRTNRALLNCLAGHSSYYFSTVI